MSAAFIQANTNGRLHPASEPSISPLNRGFLYGDAIYEVWRTYAGIIFTWEEHWARLFRSAKSLYMDLPFTPADILPEIRRTVAAYRDHTRDTGELYIRIQITRGAGAIGLDPALADRADFVLLVQPCPALAPDKILQGLKLSLATGLRRNPIDALNPAWKTGNYLNNVLCLREARARGADEVVMLNLAGEVTESAVSNIAFVRDGTVITPPLSAGILGGITRELVLTNVAPAANVPVQERAVKPEEFATMDECFLLSSTKDIAPIASIDERTFKVGPGTVALKLKAAFTDYMTAYAAAHPELRA
jgi:branched-chain amino acid aminotransferase